MAMLASVIETAARALLGGATTPLIRISQVLLGGFPEGPSASTR
jgi:hypothetical protein